MPTQSGRDARTGLILLFATGIIWGTIGIAARGIYDRSNLDAIEITWLRNALAGPSCIIAGWFMMGRRLFAVSRRDLIVSAALAILIFMNQSLFLTSIQEIGVSVATLVCLCLIPVLAAILSAVFLHEQPDRIVVISMAAAVLGTALLVAGPGVGLEGGSLWIGIGSAFASALGTAIYAIGSRLATRTLEPIQVLALGFPFTILFFAPVMRGGHLDPLPGMSVWLLVIYLGVVTQGLAYIFYQRGLQVQSATVASIVTLPQAPLAALLAWVIFDERLGILGLIGAAIMLGGLLLLSLAPRGRAPLESG